jgi:hypothetical protein
MQSAAVKTTTMERKLERLYGKSISALLADTFNREGTLKGTAQALDISEKTCASWMEKWGVTVRTVAEVAPGPTTS